MSGMYVIAKKSVLEELAVLLADVDVDFGLAFRTRIYSGSVDVRFVFNEFWSSVESLSTDLNSIWGLLFLPLLLLSASLGMTASFWIVARRKRCEVVEMKSLKAECRVSETCKLTGISF